MYYPGRVMEEGFGAPASVDRFGRVLAHEGDQLGVGRGVALREGVAASDPVGR